MPRRIESLSGLHQSLGNYFGNYVSYSHKQSAGHWLWWIYRERRVLVHKCYKRTLQLRTIRISDFVFLHNIVLHMIIKWSPKPGFIELIFDIEVGFLMYTWSSVDCFNKLLTILDQVGKFTIWIKSLSPRILSKSSNRLYLSYCVSNLFS